VDQAANRIREEVDEEANIIFGSAIDETLSGRIRVSVVAPGIDTPVAASERPRLVAVGGSPMPAPQPIPVPPQPAGAMAMHAAPHTVHAPMMGATPLRQPAAQTRAQLEQPITEGNVAFEMPPVAPPSPAPIQAATLRSGAASLSKASSTLFNEARPTATPAAVTPIQEAPRHSLFTTVTAPFRRRQAPPAPAETAVARHEPMLRSELRAEVAHVSVRTAATEEPLEIPAFLRRQDLVKRDAVG